MAAYYNEIDPFAAQWLRNLIKAELIADGEVDERSIEDVVPSDLGHFSQCHFFAGIGVWSHALRKAGWSDDRPVWTGSCPCQPFSVAGKQDGHTDPRHLWPAWFRLIRECRPPVIFGEQVEAAIRHGWLDLVQTDLEGEGYACGATVLGAHSVGAPHIRQRLWFMANDKCTRLERASRSSLQRRVDGFASIADAGIMADSAGGNSRTKREQRSREHGQFSKDCRPSVGSCCSIGTGGVCELANDEISRRRKECENPRRVLAGDRTEGWAAGFESSGGAGFVGYAVNTRLEGHTGDGSGSQGRTQEAGPTAEAGSTYWTDCDWLPCRDGKYRPVESGAFPLAHGSPQRVGRLRAYGNAIVAPVAQAFIAAYMEVCDGR